MKLTASNKQKKIWINNTEYEWVEGYKATKTDMTCKNSFQYELNKEYEHNGTTCICDAGFHFCKTLDKLFYVFTEDYTDYFPSRIFKVKALIEKSNIKYFNKGWQDKYVAKKIILVEELTFLQFKDNVKEYYSSINTEDDWKRCKEIGYDEFLKEIFVNLMKQYGYHETFIDILCGDADDNNEIEDILKHAKAYKEEGLSKDMSVYMLSKL
jgi:hypothetical protein